MSGILFLSDKKIPERLPGSLMRYSQKHSYLAQWSRRIKEKILVSSSKALTWFMYVVPYKSFTVEKCSCRKMVFLDYSCGFGQFNKRQTILHLDQKGISIEIWYKVIPFNGLQLIHIKQTSHCLNGPNCEQDQTKSLKTFHYMYILSNNYVAALKQNCK